MIEKIIATSRTTEVHGTTRLNCNAFTKSKLTEDSILKPIFERLVSQNKALGEAIDRSKAQSILAEKDDVRDYHVRAVGYLLLGYTYYPEPGICDAAHEVKAVFDKYGFAITEEGYINESSHIVSMLGDFAKPKIQAAIALLPGMAENISKLQAAENDFENTQTEYAKELAEENTKDNATTLKKAVVATVNEDLVIFLRSAQRFSADTYGAFARTIAKIIAENNEQVKKRRKEDPVVLVH